MPASYGAGDPGGAWEPRVSPRVGVGARERIALILLTVGSLVLSVFGWMIGLVLLWTSSAWTSREKLVGTLVLPGGLAPVALLLAFPVGAYGCGSVSPGRGPTGVVQPAREVCNGGQTWLSWLVVAVLVAAPIITSVWLARAASRRTSASA